MTKNKKSLKVFTLLSLLLIGSIMLISCGGNAAVQEQNVVEEVVEEVVVEPVAEPIPDQSEYHAALANGSMGRYDLGIGPNTWCSRCHSPQNWDPAAYKGPPPSCMTCKFAFDAEIRIAEGNPLVLEEDWVGIPCVSCHEVDENGTADAAISWLNPISMERVAVNTSTELCEKCHVTTTGNAFGSGVDHLITLGGSAHLNYAGFIGDVAPPQYCADCHDPHDNSSKPACDDCHAVRELDTHMLGTNAEHENVSCQACHESTGMDVGPSLNEELGGLWVTQLTSMGRGGASTEDVVSHSTTHEVLCDKCHIADSPFGLTEYTDVGEIPMVDICKDGEDLSVEKPTLADYGDVDVDFTMGECPEEATP